jgi:hypothetical protein
MISNEGWTVKSNNDVSRRPIKVRLNPDLRLRWIARRVISIGELRRAEGELQPMADGSATWINSIGSRRQGRGQSWG